MSEGLLLIIKLYSRICRKDYFLITIAGKIKGWAKEKDKLGKPLIENPENGLKTRFAKELKANGIIKQSEKTFRTKL